MDAVDAEAAVRASHKVPFSLTLVHYDEGDLVGHVLALCTLAPIFAVVAYVSIGLALGFPRKLVFMFVGQMGNVAVNLVLKHVLRMPRPADKAHLVYFGKYGMPSNHSQFMAFLAGFAVLASMRERTHLVRYPRLVAMVLVVGSLVVAWSRVYLEYHSVDQVLVGLAAGFSVAAGWFFVWTRLAAYGFVETGSDAKEKTG